MDSETADLISQLQDGAKNLEIYHLDIIYNVSIGIITSIDLLSPITTYLSSYSTFQSNIRARSSTNYDLSAIKSNGLILSPNDLRRSSEIIEKSNTIGAKGRTVLFGSDLTNDLQKLGFDLQTMLIDRTNHFSQFYSLESQISSLANQTSAIWDQIISTYSFNQTIQNDLLVSTSHIESNITEIISALHNIEVYVVDHRGTDQKVISKLQDSYQSVYQTNLNNVNKTLIEMMKFDVSTSDRNEIAAQSVRYNTTLVNEIDTQKDNLQSIFESTSHLEDFIQNNFRAEFEIIRSFFENIAGIISKENQDFNNMIHSLQATLRHHSNSIIIWSVSIVAILLFVLFLPLFRVNIDKAIDLYLVLEKQEGKRPRGDLSLSKVGRQLQLSGIEAKKRGDYQEAIDELRRSQSIFEDTRDIISLSEVMKEIGIVNKLSGNIHEAIFSFNQAAKLLKEFSADIEYSDILFQLVNTTVEINDLDQAKMYHEMMEKIVVEEVDNLVTCRTELAMGLILKNSFRARDKVDAQRIFEKVLQLDDLETDLGIFAMIHLTDLLIEEWLTYTSAEILNDILSYINKIHQIAKQTASFPLIIESLILKSKFAFINDNIEEHDLLVTQAKIIAEENNLLQLSQKIDAEELALVNYIQQWEELGEMGASLKERVNGLKLNDYLLSVWEVVVGKE